MLSLNLKFCQILAIFQGDVMHDFSEQVKY